MVETPALSWAHWCQWEFLHSRGQMTEHQRQGDIRHKRQHEYNGNQTVLRRGISSWTIDHGASKNEKN